MPLIASMERTRRRLYQLALLLLAVACSGDQLVLPGEGDPANIEVLAGHGQNGLVGGALPESLIVRVTDSRDRPIQNQPVEFALTTGLSGQLLPDTVLTDAGGRAAARWRLGTESGTQRAEARVIGVNTPLTVAFSAIAEPAPADSLVLLSGHAQVGQIGSTLPESLVVVLEDEFGNPIPGAEITWSAQNGSLDSNLVTTGSDGRAAVEWTLAILPGTQRVTAAYPGVAGSPAAFAATATVGPPPRLVIVTQPSDATQSGASLARQPELQLEDHLGNPILQAGVAVTATIATGGGILGGTTTTNTDAGGSVEFTNLSIGGATGPRTLIFAASGHTSATSAVIDVTASDPSPVQSTVLVSPGTITASAGSISSTITVTAKDVFGNPIAGAAVLLAATGSGNQLTQPGLTNGSGVATGSLSSTASGGKIVSATVDNVAINQSPTITVTPGAASASGTTAAVPASGTAGVVSTITITVKDAFGNAIPSGGAAITVLVTGSNSTTAGVTDHGNGSYTATYTPIVAGTDVIAITLNGVAIGGSPFNSLVGAGSVSPSLSTVIATPSSIPASAGSSQATITVTARDASGNLVPGATAVISASGTGNTLTQPSSPTSPAGITTGTLSSTVAESKTVTASINGVSLSQSVTLTVNPGAANPATSSAVVPSGKVLKATTVVVTARDQWGNRLTGGGATVVMTVSGSNTRGPITANDNGDGTYTASYSPFFLGSDTIAITLNGTAIAGSPFTSAVGF